MPPQDINLNSSHCLRTVNDIGVQHIHNICSGIVTDVPWGTMDWVFVGGASIGGIVFLVMLGAFATIMIKDF